MLMTIGALTAGINQTSYTDQITYGKGGQVIDMIESYLGRETFQRVAPHIQSRGATFSAEWLVLPKRAGYRFAETPVSHLPRTAGSQTGARPDVIKRAFRELWQFRRRLWQEGPDLAAPAGQE